MHPDNATAHVEAWTEKQKRADRRIALQMHNQAVWSGNVKKGVTLKLSDFEPEYCRTKPELEPSEVREARLKMRLNGLAQRTKPKD